MNKAAEALETTPAAGTDIERIRAVFAAQRETMLRWRRSSVGDRLARIQRLADAIDANSAAVAEAGAKDFRKPPEEVELTEIVPVLAEAKDAQRHLKRWMKPKKVGQTRMTVGLKAWIQYEPRGRALIISPWNYPANLTFGPLISALAAGCPVILKPSELTPNMSAVMARIISETFDETEVALFEGEADVAQALLELPFDHIFFTGSPQIGKVVMAAAAKHLTSVTLELGGKSPVIIDESADLDLAARTIAWGKYTNAGQTCIAPDHIYVHNAVKDAFTRKLADVISNSYGDSPDAQMQSPYLARIVNARHAGRVNKLLEDARSRGATVLAGGEGARPEEQFVPPTLLGDVPNDAEIMREEIFGPLLPIIGYDDLDDVIRRINDDPKPLALYIWSKTEPHINKVLNHTSAGGTCINHVAMHFMHSGLPFGGVNNSGIGSAHGRFGFMAFSHERAVLRTRFMLAKLFFPPYGGLARRIIMMMRKTV